MRRIGNCVYSTDVSDGYLLIAVRWPRHGWPYGNRRHVPMVRCYKRPCNCDRFARLYVRRGNHAHHPCVAKGVCTLANALVVLCCIYDPDGSSDLVAFDPGKDAQLCCKRNRSLRIGWQTMDSAGRYFPSAFLAHGARRGILSSIRNGVLVPPSPFCADQRLDPFGTGVSLSARNRRASNFHCCLWMAY